VTIRLIFYNIIILTLGLLTFPWIVYQLVFVKKRRTGLAQRYGRSPVMEKKAIWCHAVSVGEVRAITPMLSLLQDDETAQDRIVLSTVTVTGQETANRECGFVSQIFYFPLDLPFITDRSIQRINPEIFVTAETEIWPNFFNCCFRRNIPVVIVNGRISDTSFSRYFRFRWFFRPVLQRVSLFLMQSDEDARRIVEIGAKPEKVKVTGNMKYDRVPEPVSLPAEINSWADGGFMLVAGSTHAGEEEIVLQAIGELVEKDILLALVPRHPERFDEVAGLLEKDEVPYTRYTDILKGEAPEGAVLLVDAMGVLDGFYALADVAFVGGSLVPIGGHNLLEPAAHGIPVLTGPHVNNFREIAMTLVDLEGCLYVKGSPSMAKELELMIQDNSRRLKMGASAAYAYNSIGGASKRNVKFMLDMICF